ncbi:hypothetical protein K438DRAFT_2007909 [Mycena galopus ATCC 62051]|nr:hypothetical protein K438DRAFT_2007909 [Mycena galopus ATCC 62051]
MLIAPLPPAPVHHRLPFPHPCIPTLYFPLLPPPPLYTRLRHHPHLPSHLILSTLRSAATCFHPLLPESQIRLNLANQFADLCVSIALPSSPRSPRRSYAHIFMNAPLVSSRISRHVLRDTTASLPQLKRASRGSPESRTHPFSLLPAVFLRSHPSRRTPLLTPSANINTSPGPCPRLRRPPSYSPLDEAVHCRGTVQARRNRLSRHGVKGWVVLVRVPSARVIFLERARGPRRWRTYRRRCGDVSLSPQIVPLLLRHTRRRRAPTRAAYFQRRGGRGRRCGCGWMYCRPVLLPSAVEGGGAIWMAYLPWSTSISIASPAPLPRYRCMGVHIAPYRFGGTSPHKPGMRGLHFEQYMEADVTALAALPAVYSWDSCRRTALLGELAIHAARRQSGRSA